MPALLCISADPKVSALVEQLAAEFGIRARILVSEESAREWLSMQHFDILLVDRSVLTAAEVLQALTTAWKHNPLMHGAVIDLAHTFKDAFEVQLLGGQVYDGPAAAETLRAFFKSLPSTIAFGQSSYYGVLVVEDLDSPRDIICAYVESLGYAVVKGVASAQAAISELEAKPYEYFCVITDLQMPEMNGEALISYIRSHSLLKVLPVVVLTSTPSTGNLVACLRAGASGFIAKPPKKLILQKELERAKRLLISKQSPRLCEASDAEKVEEQLRQFRQFS